ncbi:MAG: ABC transporter permease [Oscillospiraceae bacterium]|nr:ABC transporter permease [Oscillospiraceae bacterium]
MIKYILNRVLQTVFVLFGVATATFVLTYVVPGDPATLIFDEKVDSTTISNIRHEMAIDENIFTQYFSFLKKMLRLDFGKSYFSNKIVLKTVLSSFYITCKISLVSILISTIFGILFGVFSAINRGDFIDLFLMSGATSFIAMPTFWIAMVLQIIFAFKLNWFPIIGTSNIFLPCIALSLKPASSMSRFTRTTMIGILNQEYIKTARAKGLSNFRIIFVHALKNALISIITLIGMQVGNLLAGSMLVETIFSIPGIGKLVVNSVLKRDLPMIEGCVIYIAFIFVIVNLIVDLLYHIVNPKIRVNSNNNEN